MQKINGTKSARDRRVYTGVHLLRNKDKKSQFGVVDAWSDFPELSVVVRIILGKQLNDRIHRDQDGIEIEMNLNEATILVEQLNTVTERIKHLIILSKKEKLVDNAYYLKTKSV